MLVLMCFLLLQVSGWSESLSTSHKTYLTSSTENIYTSTTSSQQHHHQPSSSSSSSGTAPPPAVARKPQFVTPLIPHSGSDASLSSVQHGNYAQELLKQSQNTKYLLSQGSESSRKHEGLNSANSSSVNLSDTSFSSGGSGQAGGGMPQPGSHADGKVYATRGTLVANSCSLIIIIFCCQT